MFLGLLALSRPQIKANSLLFTRVFGLLPSCSFLFSSCFTIRVHVLHQIFFRLFLGLLSSFDTHFHSKDAWISWLTHWSGHFSHEYPYMLWWISLEHTTPLILFSKYLCLAGVLAQIPICLFSLSFHCIMPSHFFKLVAYSIFFVYFLIYTMYDVRTRRQIAWYSLSIGSQVKLNMLCHALRGICSWISKLVSCQLLFSAALIDW